MSGRTEGVSGAGQQLLAMACSALNPEAWQTGFEVGVVEVHDLLQGLEVAVVHVGFGEAVAATHVDVAQRGRAKIALCPSTPVNSESPWSGSFGSKLADSGLGGRLMLWKLVRVGLVRLLAARVRVLHGQKVGGRNRIKGAPLLWQFAQPAPPLATVL